MVTEAWGHSVCVCVSHGGKTKRLWSDPSQLSSSCSFLSFFTLSPLSKVAFSLGSVRFFSLKAEGSLLSEDLCESTNKNKSNPLWLLEMRLLCMRVSRSFGCRTQCIESPRWNQALGFSVLPGDWFNRLNTWQRNGSWLVRKRLKNAFDIKYHKARKMSFFSKSQERPCRACQEQL